MDKIKLSKSKYSTRYSLEFKKQVCNEYLTGNFTKKEIWEKYTGHKQEHGSLLKWLRELGYVKYGQNINFALAMKTNKKEKTLNGPKDTGPLKRKIKELEKALADAELKAFAYSTMIDVAEKELKISIRKK